MATFSTGQRWVSEMEPELGLGVIKQLDDAVVSVYFPASECDRHYSIHSAPLKRVAFKAGDRVKSRYGRELTVTETVVENGRLTYYSEDGALDEDELCDYLSISSPQERLFNGFVGDNSDFNMRLRSLQHQHQARSSRSRGFMGGRIDLIPHQMYVVHEVSAQPYPRVLLSDETGLGKTIEVCLVLHRLLINGRINRVLIVVPQSLVHQWFVELLRKFNLFFRIFDEDYCDAVAKSDPATNPFEQDQLGLCSIDFLISHPRYHNEAVAAGWDMLVMDEAHHLTEGSQGYHIAEELSAAAKGLMLLTATPEQLGHQSHFARLRLLDPARYHEFEEFEKEENHYLTITEIVNNLMDMGTLSENDIKRLKSISPGSIKGSQRDFGRKLKADPAMRRQLIKDLLDRHGTGRAVFRNTRASMTGFPERNAHLIALDADAAARQSISREFEAELPGGTPVDHYNFQNDPRVLWLVECLKSNRNRKLLLICNALEKVLAIDEALRHQTNADISLFHEDLTLIQRDRNAAWFAKDNGAQILICSEIGSEGRNFQFAHHLVLFDLPLDPEVLEQRIGRLDRIGQKETIAIHVPYIVGSGYECVAHWYHHGLNAFEKNVPGVYRIFCEMNAELIKHASACDMDALQPFIIHTQQRCISNVEALRKGRDRLLELNSFQPALAKELIEDIQTIDSDQQLETFMLDVFQHFGIRTEEIDFRTYKLDLTMLSCPDFPLPKMRQDDIAVTFCRKSAIKHETMVYLTWDHPMVIGSMDLIQGAETGICALANWPDPERKVVILEALYVLECIAPAHLYADRFLPAHPVRIVVDHHLRDCATSCSTETLALNLELRQSTEILDNPHIKQGLLPRMLDTCQELAELRSGEIIDSALSAMETDLSREVHRLAELQTLNPAISAADVQGVRDEMDQLREAISSSRIRLDALRFITRGAI